MRSAEHAATAPLTKHTVRGGNAMGSTRRVLNVKVGESFQETGARRRDDVDMKLPARAVA